MKKTIFFMFFGMSVIFACAQDSIKNSWDVDWIFESGGLIAEEIKEKFGVKLEFHYGSSFMETYRLKKSTNTMDYTFSLYFNRNGRLFFTKVYFTPLNKTEQQFILELRQHIVWFFKLNEYSKEIPEKNISFNTSSMMGVVEFEVSYRL